MLPCSKCLSQARLSVRKTGAFHGAHLTNFGSTFTRRDQTRHSRKPYCRTTAQSSDDRPAAEADPDATAGAKVRTSIEADRVIAPSFGDSDAGASSRDDQSDVRRRRIKGKQLLLILNSGNRIEDVIEEHKHAIDTEMLEMLEARIEAARQSGERSTARGLGLVYRRLAAEMERLQATGAERLLDSLLQAMSENKDLEPDELREELEELMIEGFGAPSNSHIDIFSAAAQLAAGGEVEAGESVLEPVTPSAFLEATQQLLQQATAYQDELKLVAAKRPENVDLAKLERIMTDRAAMISDLKFILELAASVQLG